MSKDDAPRGEIVIPEYKCVFVAGSEEEGAANQTQTIEELAKEGWEWSGFSSVLGLGVEYASGHRTAQHDNDGVVGAASVTTGVFLYFRRMPEMQGQRSRPVPVTRAWSEPKEAAEPKPSGTLPRKVRRQIEREHRKHVRALN